MFDYHATLAVIGGILFFAPIALYIATIVRGKTRPDAISWGGWMVLASIAAAAQIVEGASWSVVIPLTSAIADGSVFLLSLKYGYKKFTHLDAICLVLGIVAIGAWVLTKEPLVALALSILADAIVATPTIAKTLRKPHSEAPLPWLLFALGAGLGALSTERFDFANLAFPIYLFLLCSLIGFLALRSRISRRGSIFGQ